MPKGQRNIQMVAVKACKVGSRHLVPPPAGNDYEEKRYTHPLPLAAAAALYSAGTLVPAYAADAKAIARYLKRGGIKPFFRDLQRFHAGPDVDPEEVEEGEEEGAEDAEGPAEKDITAETLDEYTKSDLQDILRDLDLTIGGTKPEVISRLLNEVDAGVLRPYLGNG